MIRVAINGFGRIGRQILQAGFKDKKIDWVAVNDTTDCKTLAYLLKYDSVYGISPLEIKEGKNELIINGKRIPVLSERDPEKLPWKKLNVDIVLECTGYFTDREGAMKHIKAGAKKVLISAPAKNADITIVKGVNELKYDKRKHNIISNASCTTNCIAPIAKIINDTLKIKRGFMTTAHAYTATQKLVDGPGEDLRRARAAAQNIIPTTTGAARAIAEVIPELKGKLDGCAWRVPVLCGSYANMVLEVQKKTSIEEINKIFKQAAAKMKGILQYTEDPIVSTDILQNPHSCIFDALSTNVIDENLISVSGWYDNEWGFSCRMVDLAKLLL